MRAFIVLLAGGARRDTLGPRGPGGLGADAFVRRLVPEGALRPRRDDLREARRRARRGEGRHDRTPGPYGRSAPRAVATVETSIDGKWSYRVKPGIQTIYQARVGPVQSPKVTIGVEPAVYGDELLNGRIRAQVRAAQPFTRRIVQLQTRNSDGSWTTTDRARLSAASIAVFPAPCRRPRSGSR